jgi:autotransporter-associated beta strand protein
MKIKYSNILYGILLMIFGFIQQVSAQKTFVHPGIPFTQSDLDKLKINITQEPWLTGYNALINDYRSKLSYTKQGPFATVTRAPDLNNNAWKTDMVAIHNLTFMYVFTGDADYAAKATEILDAWAVTNTTWGGGENMLDIGDYVPYFVTAADILKSTYPGWTAANTTHVNNYFANVLYPASWVPNPLRDCNKGAIQIQIALGIAAFLDDETKWNQAIESYRMEAGATLRNSLPSGQVGDTGRDDHWFGQAWALAWDAEVAFKQGVDMFAEMNNRVLAIGELYNHYAIDPTGLTFTNYGGYSTYWTSGWGIPTGARKQHPFNNIIQAAYSLRKGIPTPYTDQMRALVGEGAWSFLYLKSSDNSTATPMTPIVYPSESAVPSNYFSNTDIGVTGIKGSVTSNAGTWTAKGSGSSPANSNNFTFKPIKGDAAIVAKIENNSISSAMSGLMIRESLSTTSNYASINFNPAGTITASSIGSTAAAAGYTHYGTSSPWWLKLERVGNRVFVYHSQDGIAWTNIALFIMTLPTDAYIGFYTISNNASALNTATFSNVAINNTFAVGSPEINSTTSATATLGTPFNFNITATGSPTAYAATALPTGLSIDSATGVVSGTPTTAGKNVVLLEATNANGTGKAALVIDVISNQTPIAINNLSVSSANSIIKLTWTGTANATSYTVKRSLTSGGPYTNIQTNITGTSFVDPAPAYEVNNYYVVTALIGENESAISNQASGAIPPAIPSNLVATNQNGQVNLTWSAADGASTYKIKRATTSGGPYTQIAAVSSTSYSDAAVTNGTAYYYVVTSQGNTLESSASSEVFGNPGTNSLTWSATPTSTIFNLASNWAGNSVPTNPAILTFKTSEATSLTNNITGLVASRILFDTDAVSYTIGGNSFNLKSDLINNSALSQILSLPIVLDGQLNVNAKTNSLELSGVVSGTGSLLKTGTSALVMSGLNTYSGNTIIRGTTGYKWGSTDGIQVLGIGTGTSGAPISGPLGTGKIILEGGALYTGLNTAIATLYNDIEVATGNAGYFYERQGALNLYGRLFGNGTLVNDGSDNYANISLYGNNSGFAGTFITKLRSGAHRMAFMVPESGSANAAWLLDAQGVDCHRIMFASGTLEFGSLSGRGGIRCNVAGTPIIRIGALNTNTTFSGTLANASGTLLVEKVGTGTLTFSGNSTFGGATTILNGTFLLNNDGSTGDYRSPIIAQNGAFGGYGKSANTVTIGTGSGAGATLVPGTDGAIGTFTTTGLVTLNADATYKVDVNNTAVTCDKVMAANITLNQSILMLNSIDSGTLPSGTAFTILDNTGTGAITGTFKDLPEMATITLGRYSFNITYVGGNGNDVQLLNSNVIGQMYYKFDEQSGTQATDSWGTNHGTLQATATRDTGRSGLALKLDGTSTSYATLPANIVSSLSDYTISSWVKMDALANWMRVFDFGTGTTKYMFLSVQTGTAGNVRFAVKNGGSEQGMTYSYAVPLNTWTHFAITQSGNTCSMYINGALVATNTAVTIKPSTIGSMNQNYLGKSQWSSDSMFKGAIDEFKIFSRALTAAEIAASYLNQTITLNATATKVTGDADFSPATASSGLPITYTSSNPSVASIVDGKVHVVAAGTSTITASQAGNEVYRQAQSQTQVLTVQQAQTISFAAIGTKLLGDADFDPLATASSGLAVTYASSNGSVASIVNGKVHILGTGTTTITASQVGDNTYAPAQSQTQVLTVVITNNTVVSAVMGTTFTYTITNNTALNSFTATGLPAGLSLNATTGVISGTPTEYGDFAVALTASNGSISGSQTITLTVYTIVNNVIVASGDAKNIIEWDAIQNFSYNIKRSTTSGGAYTSIGTVTAPTFTDTNVSNGSTYYYVVSAINSLGENSNSAEVTATPNTGQITYLKFDEASGTRGIDSWGANHAALQATATRDTGFSGSALKLDGTSTSYTTLPTGIVSTLTDFTISAWVRMDVESNWMRVFDFGAGTSTYMFLTIQAGTANVMRYAIKNGGSEQQLSYNYTLPLNTWTHFAITQSGNTCSMYINGNLVSTNTGISIKPTNLGSTNLNYIGKSQWNDPLFKGSIDEFKIYNRALSAEEIVEEQNQSTQKIDNNTLKNDLSTNNDIVIINTIIYPNPVVNNRFTIVTNTELVEKEVEVKLIDFTGRIVYLKSNKNSTGTIEVVLNQVLPDGIYILLLNNQYSAKVYIK